MASGDAPAGTPVTLVVVPSQTVPSTPPPAHHPLPFTGFALIPMLALAAGLLAVGLLSQRLFRSTTSSGVPS